jgi:uncharacterized protein (TIGR00369 family)
MEQNMDTADSLPRTGLDLVKKLFASGGSPRGIGRTMRFAGTSVERGIVTLEGNPDEDFYNPLGTVHGGYAATMLDAALALAVQSTLPPHSGYSTIELKITYLRPMTASSAPVIAVGKTLHEGRRIVACEGRLTDREGKLCAHATATYMVLARSE